MIGSSIHGLLRQSPGCSMPRDGGFGRGRFEGCPAGLPSQLSDILRIVCHV